MIATDFKEFLTIKIKPRDDNLYDQYSRIFMTKVLLVTSLVCGISWYADKFNCILPEQMMIGEDFPAFVGSTCWIQGVYVYKELNKRNDQVAYYGISKDIELDGMIQGELCKTYKRPENIRNENCIPMKKTFYLQYQYMPFLLGAMAIMYYLPYIFHRTVNYDLLRLKRQTERENPDPSFIYRVFFKEIRGKPIEKSTVMYRHVLFLMVKVCYLVVNIGAFYILDGILNGLFTSYGSRWFEWTSLNNTQQFDYMGGSDHPKPANDILPPFGYCEIWSSAKDIRDTHVNKHKVVCELSQFVLYQYSFILLWLCIVVGIILAVIGLLYAIYRMIAGYLGLRRLGHNPEIRKIYKRLTVRQMDYFEYLKQQNMALYGEVIALFSEDLTNDSVDEQGEEVLKPLSQSPGRKRRDDLELTRRPGYAL